MQARKLAWTLWWFPCPIDSSLEFYLYLASRHILSAFGRQRCQLLHCIYDFKRTNNGLSTKHCFLKVKSHCSKCDRETQIYSRSLSPQVQKLSEANFICRLAGPFLWVSRCTGNVLFWYRRTEVMQGQLGFGEANHGHIVNSTMTIHIEPPTKEEKESLQGNFIYAFFPIILSSYYMLDIF